MSIFAPQNVMGPAHRGGVIQQLAQGAAQNVMRRQKLKALLQNSAGQAASRSIGGGVAFRGSMQGHATGVRGAVQRPAQLSGGTGQSFMQGGGLLANQANPFSQADPGTPDLPSLPDPTDPRQSPASTAPVTPQVPNGPNLTLDQLNAQLAAQGQPTQAYPTTITPDGGTGQTNSQLPVGQQLNLPGDAPVISSSMIPLGSGVYYDPTTDSITGGGRRPGAQM